MLKCYIMVEWKEYNSYYISSKGDVIGTSGRLITGTKNTKGYYQTQGKNKKKILLHRLIAECWCNCPGEFHNYQVNHIDGNKDNNNPSNLEWLLPDEHRIKDSQRRLLLNTSLPSIFP